MTTTDTTAERYAAVEAHFHHDNEEIGHLSEGGTDPYRLQALLEVRAHLWHELAAIADGREFGGDARPAAVEPPVPSLYAVACHYAAILDQEAAAAVRFEHGIPTLFPRSEAGKLHLRACAACGRPWQCSAEGACPRCPRITYGPSPSSAAQARQFPEPEPVTVWPELGGGYGASVGEDQAEIERARPRVEPEFIHRPNPDAHLGWCLQCGQHCGHAGHPHAAGDHGTTVCEQCGVTLDPIT